MTSNDKRTLRVIVDAGVGSGGGEGGDMATRLTWRHLAASRGHDAEFVFWPRPAQEDNILGTMPGSYGWCVGMMDLPQVRMSTDTDSLFSCAREKKEPENQCGARFPPPQSPRLRRTCRALKWPEATRMDGPESRCRCLWMLPKESVGMRRRPASRDYGVTWPAEDRRSRAGRDPPLAAQGLGEAGQGHRK